MKQNLYPERLLLSLDKFVQQMHRQNKADNPKLILKLVTRWTQAQPLLTKKLLQYILQSQGRIRAGTEAIAVEEIVKHRLLKEFKQDKLTLAIRTFLYQKDLKTLLERTKGHITNREQAYLINLQKELGLSNQQCQAIKNQNLVFSDSQHIRQRNRLLADRQGKYKNVEPNLALTKVVNKNLTASSSSLTLNPQPSALTKQTILPGNKRQTVTKSSQKQWTWLWLGISLLLLLFIRGFNWSRSFQLTTTSNLDVQQQKLCIDLASRQSPRMSLGEKVLTQEYNHLQTLSMISLYQGSAAFARCEFSIAKK